MTVISQLIANEKYITSKELYAHFSSLDWNYLLQYNDVNFAVEKFYERVYPLVA